MVKYVRASYKDSEYCNLSYKRMKEIMSKIREYVEESGSSYALGILDDGGDYTRCNIFDLPTNRFYDYVSAYEIAIQHKLSNRLGPHYPVEEYLNDLISIGRLDLGLSDDEIPEVTTNLTIQKRLEELL